MSLPRRRLLLASVAVPVAAMLRPAEAMASAAERRLAGWRRPTPVGTSASRCAACGEAGHTMLDPACPARRSVRRSRPSAGR